MKRNASRPLKVLLSNPEENGLALMIVRARALSGWAAKNAFSFSGSGLPVAGSGFDASQLVVESLSGVDREDGDINHCRPPLFPIGWREVESQAAHGRRAVGHKGVAPG